MKNILLIIGLLVGLVSFGQTPAYYQQYPTRANFISGKFDSSLHIPRGCGKPTPYTSMNTKNWKYGFALYGDTCNKKLYQYVDSTWTLIGDSVFNDIRYLANTISCGLTCSACGIVTYTGTGMNYYVSPAYYNIDFVPYYFAGDSVTLADGDATFDRFDAIVLTATGVDTIQGVPSSDPQLPQFDPCANILLTYVLVTAGTTTPAQVSDEVIYDENVETWTHTTGGTITANFAGTAQVFHGTKSITISSWSNNSYINFLGPSSYINSNYSTLSFWVRLTAIMVNNQNVSVQFFNNTTAVSNPVVGQITKGNITTYQSVGFNMSQFTFTSPVFNTVRIQFSGNQSNTFYIDWIRLQAGIVQPPAPTGLNNAYTRVTDGTTTATAIGGDIFKLRANAPLHTTVTNNDATHGDNALFFADTLRSIANSLATNGIVKKQIDSLAALTGRFGVSGEDDLATGDRLFDLNDKTFELYQFDVGNSRLTIIPTSGSYLFGDDDDSYISFDTTAHTASIQANAQTKIILDDPNKTFSILLGDNLDRIFLDATNKDYIFGDRYSGGDGNNTYLEVDDNNKKMSFKSGTGDRITSLAGETTLTESSATAFIRVNIPTGETSGGEVVVSIHANDASDFQNRTLRFIWAAVNKAGTITVNISTPEEQVAVSAGTLTATITAVDSGSGNLDFKANAVSSLTQTVLKANAQVIKNFGSGTVLSQ